MMNTIANNNANTQATNNAIAAAPSATPVAQTVTNSALFTAYINSDVAAEQAAESLRQAMVTIVINNTALKSRVTTEEYLMLLDIAKVIIEKKTITLYKNDDFLERYNFMGNSQQILDELMRFMADVIVGYNCYFEDRISYSTGEGFCWQSKTGNKIAIV